MAEISLQLAQDLDVDRILTAIVERSMELTHAQYGAVLTLSADGQIERFVHRGLSPEQVALLPRLPRGRGLLGEVLTARKPIRLPKISEHPSSVGFPTDHVLMEAFLGVPLQRSRELVGALYLTKPPQLPGFTAEDESLVLIAGSMAAVGIQNARLLQSEFERAERGSLLRGIASRVRRSLETSDVLAATVEALGRAAKVDRCFIRLVEPGSAEATLGPIEYEWDAPGIASLKDEPDAPFPLIAKAAATRTTQWSEDLTVDERAGDPALRDLVAVNTRAALATPLEWGDQLLGAVAFHSSLPRRWTPSDVALIEAAAREVAVAIDHAQRYRDAVETAARLRELDHLRRDFVSMVSHELRSPMTVVAGMANILEKRYGRLSEQQRKELVETLGREARRLARLVSEVLDLEAMEQGSLRLEVVEVDLAALTREAVVDAALSERAVVRVLASDATVKGDRDRLKQVLLNLVFNAAKFSGEDAPITITVDANAATVGVAVADEGPGIRQDQQARLFEPFSRVGSPAREPGSGLGLFLSKKIVEQHGGEISVHSELGKGATFSFRIPR